MYRYVVDTGKGAHSVDVEDAYEPLRKMALLADKEMAKTGVDKVEVWFWFVGRDGQQRVLIKKMTVES